MEGGIRDMARDLNVKTWIHQTRDRVLDTFFPRFCVRCSREGSACCESCLEAYVPRAPEASCAFCGTAGSPRTCASCQRETSLDGLTALSAYGDPVVRKALKAWKYVGDEAYRDVVERWVRRSDLDLPLELSAPLVPVPLHVTRRRERGFDQAERFAEQVSTMTGRPYTSLLARIHRTHAQAQRGHAARLVGDLDGIFRIEDDVPEAVILCDDVFTSGATMDAAAKCLKEAGAETVWGLVLARG